MQMFAIFAYMLQRTRERVRSRNDERIAILICPSSLAMPADNSSFVSLRIRPSVTAIEPELVVKLFSENFLNLADFLLDLPTDLFDLAFNFQIWIVRRSSNLLFSFTFHFVKCAFCLVLSALLHGFSPW